MTKKELIKTQFDFGWKKWGSVIPAYAKPTLDHQKGDILDIGCATCELYIYLTKNGWDGNYYGIDIKKYEEYEYPDGANLIIGDPMKIEFPEVDTIILYNILEHLDDPVSLLDKAISNSKKNVLINIPKRNEELWQYGVVEFHQLDKTHKHCGFSTEEVYKLCDLANGHITSYKELVEIKPVFGLVQWDNKLAKVFMIMLNRGSLFILNLLFSSNKFYSDIWCEVVKK
nr:class I SAM-dependent methyltransferase [uncultured Methanobacterium sp.]